MVVKSMDGEVTLQQLRAFRTVVEQGTFTRAAEDLHLSQPVVSLHIKALEEHLDAKLLIRHPRGVVLTPDGEIVYKYADEILTKVRAMRQLLAENRGQMSQRITVGAGFTCAQYLLPRVLVDFHRRFPSCRVMLDTVHTTNIHARILNDQVDVGITFNLRTPRGLISHPLYSEDLVFIVPGGHPLAGQPVGLRELRELPFILPPRRSSALPELIESLLGLTLPELGLNVVMEVSDPDVIKAAVTQGAGASALLRSALGRELAAGDLAEFYPVLRPGHDTTGPSHRWAVQHFLVYRQEKRLSPALQAFLSCLEDALATVPGLRPVVSAHR